MRFDHEGLGGEVVVKTHFVWTNKSKTLISAAKNVSHYQTFGLNFGQCRSKVVFWRTSMQIVGRLPWPNDELRRIYIGRRLSTQLTRSTQPKGIYPTFRWNESQRVTPKVKNVIKRMWLRESDKTND